MASLLTSFSPVVILIVLIVAIPELLRFVNWIIGTVKKHKANQDAAFESGREKQKRAEKKEDRLAAIEEKEQELEITTDQQGQEIEELRRQVELLTKSNMLEIKETIKRTLDTVRITRYIDAYALSILEDRFEIYKASGGNSWGDSMMKEIRKIAVTTEAASLEDDKNSSK